ncbi:MAG: glycosyltransferase family 2 protein [Oscillospiraceae bacterium]|nr:glycosyltransferase family 2 protein [Oscillospiraceae bacterium]
MAPVLYIVVPCYNEQAVLPITAPLFLKKLGELAEKGLASPDSRLLFVDDGSRDASWDLISDMARRDARVLGIRQSRNRGHQNAVLAGLMEAKDRCDVTVSIDCDGQDDLDAMDRMLEAYAAGCDVVYGVREDRESDSFFKRTSAQAYYKLLAALGAEVVYNHADYRLISARVLRELENYREVNLYLRGLIPLVGFRSGTVSYKRAKRLAGESHYPLGKMLALAADGVTSLTVKPLRLITSFGILVALVSFIGVLWALITALCGRSVPGWASTTCIVCFVGGVQLISLGVIGEYVGKIYLETKQRPRYIISERTDSSEFRARDSE